MASFDIVSELDLQEADNAVNQAIKEVQGRFDFKGSKSEFKWDKKEIILLADDDYKLSAMTDILQSKMHRRGIDIRALKFEKVEEATGNTLRQKVSLQQGIDKEKAKSISQTLRDSKLKIQVQIIDEKVRITSKSIDTLQETMTFLKTQDFGVPLQFNNMRS